MTFARWSLILPILWGVQVAAPDPSPPTALEQALIEHVCSATRAPGVVESGAYRDCLNLKLLSIRADFGRDLSRLSASERRTIDSVCSKVLEAREREAYLECLNGQLVALSNRRSRAAPDPSAATPPPSPPPVSAPPASPPPPAQTSSSLSGLWIAVAVVTVLIAAGAVLLVKKVRRAPSKCRVCGVVDVPQPGALCQQCRREAAEAARRAATERVDHERAQLEELRQQKAREEEDARLRDQEQVRQREEEAARQREHEASGREGEARRREEEARQSSQAGVTAQEDVFDPYAILGVSRDASQQEIRAAYDEAKLKYDLDHVAHLGPELQEHFKAKAQAMDRAYQMLTG